MTVNTRGRGGEGKFEGRFPGDQQQLGKDLYWCVVGWRSEDGCKLEGGPIRLSDNENLKSFCD